MVVGVYRPPERERPSYDPALTKMLKLNLEQREATVIAGDLNTDAWDSTGKGAYQNWEPDGIMWDLSGPQLPT